MNYERIVGKCLDRHDSVNAFLLKLIAATYADQADFINAIKYCKRSISILVQNKNEFFTNKEFVIERYYRLSAYCDSINDVAGKMEALDSCANIAIRLKSVNVYCLWALYTRSEYFFDVGDYERCIEYAEMCENLGDEYANEGSETAKLYGSWYASASVTWHVNALIALKNYDAANDLLLAQVEKGKKTGLKKNSAALYDQLAEVQVSKGNYKMALSYYGLGLQYARAAGSTNNCKTILNNIGETIYLNYYKDLDRALYYFKESVAINGGNTRPDRLDSIETLNALNSVATLFVRRRQYDSATKYFRLAFDHIKSGINEKEILFNALDEFDRQKKVRYITNLVIAKGDANLAQFKDTRQPKILKDAIHVYKFSDNLLDRIKEKQFDFESKLFWRKDSRLLYEHAIEACYLANNIEDAFYFFEKSRSVLLEDQLNEQRWFATNDILRQNQIKKKILQLERQKAALDKSSEEYKQVTNELFSAKDESDRLINAIKISNPLYYQSFIDTSSLTLQDVRKKILADYNGIIEIFTGDSAVYSLVITSEKVYFKSYDKHRFRELSDSYIHLMSNAGLLNSSYHEFVHVSSQLYQLIFRDITIPPGRIIISPDDSYFPFEALVTNNVKKQVSYFVSDYAVTYSYSTRYLLYPFNFNSSPSSTFMGLAPVRYASKLNLQDLAGSDNSLEKIRGYFTGSTTMTAGTASRSNFLQDFYKHKIIQLYTHAADHSLHGEPVIYFADSALYLSDLVSESKPATRLIVLSACETGLGKVYQGEGVFSFNRGFAALGIPSSISNLWAVDNKATYRLTELFYKYLSKGISSDVALQKAKIEFIESAQNSDKLPYYWAATIITGVTDTIVTRSGVSTAKLLVIGGIVALTIFTILLWLKKSRKMI